jgi:hypothetical protein
MFKILELDNTPSSTPTEVGDGSGHNPEGGYWWARDAEVLRKCWISADGDGAIDVACVEGPNRGRRRPSA